VLGKGKFVNCNICVVRCGLSTEVSCGVLSVVGWSEVSECVGT
jgi:hypothetical protein